MWTTETEVKMSINDIPVMNTKILEQMTKSKLIVPICKYDLVDCKRVRITIAGEEIWTDKYYTNILDNYANLSHSLCPEHLREMYIRNGLEDLLPD